MKRSRVMHSRKRTVFVAFVIACVALPSLTFAADMSNMQGMAGMNMASGTASGSANISIPDIAKLNTQPSWTRRLQCIRAPSAIRRAAK